MTIATLFRRHQEETLHHTGRSADRVDRTIAPFWSSILDVLSRAESTHHAQTQILMLFGQARSTAFVALDDGMVKIAERSWESSSRALAEALPIDFLRKRVQLLREGRTTGREALIAQLFPSPSNHAVYNLVKRLSMGGQTWEQSFRKSAHTFSAHQIASIIALGYSQGKTQREIAQDLLPAVDGLRVSARRIARTYGMAIAHQAQMEAHAHLGELALGYTVHAVLDVNTRPAHRARNGESYYKRPGAGQKGFSEMPRPPLEANGDISYN